MRSVQSTLFALLVASSAAFADTSLNLTPGVSPISHDVYELHMTVFWICVGIGILVFGAMFYAIIYHRKSRGAVPAQFHSHPWLEITWTILPAVILVLMAIPATKVLLNMNNNDQEDLTIKITGYQWKWHYEYLEDGVSFFSNLSTPQNQMMNEAPKGEHYLREVDNPIVVPIHKKVRFLITSNDVNHAWWVPDLGVKRDAVAGFINEAWTIIDKPGTYRGQCAELCGINHAFMPIVVVATTEQGYKDWVAKQKGQATQGEADTTREWTMDELIKHGEGVYNKICAACHQPTGMGLPPTFPALKGGPIVIGPIGKHVETVMNGVSGTAMQAFKNQLSDVELASVITYERNAWGNDTKTLVQPIQIKAYRDGKPIAEALTTKPGPAGAPAQPAAAGKPSEAAPTQVPSDQSMRGAAQQSTTVQAAPSTAVGETSTAPATAVTGAAVSSQAANAQATEPASSTATAPQASTTAQPESVPSAGSEQTTTPPTTTVQKTVTPSGESTTTTITITTTTKATTTTTAGEAKESDKAKAAESEKAQAKPASETVKPSTSAQPVEPAKTATPSAAAKPVATTSVSPEAMKAAIANGEKVYASKCAVCHQPTGLGMPPVFPALKGGPIVVGPVGEHIHTVMDGHPGTAMVAFKDQLNDQELADVITFERNSWGNNTGTLVTVEDIKSARQQPAQTKN